MNATSDLVLPVVEPIADLTYSAIDHGIEYADDLLRYEDDPWYWSHSARFAIRNHLLPRLNDVPRWSLRSNVPNCGIHFSLDNAHPLRLVRSLGTEAPPPGGNRRRRQAWTNHPQLDLECGPERLPLLSLLMDWHLVDGEPAVFVSLPREPWKYGAPMRTHWRRLLPRPSAGALVGLSFPGEDDGDPLVTIHRSEEATS